MFGYKLIYRGAVLLFIAFEQSFLYSKSCVQPVYNLNINSSKSKICFISFHYIYRPKIIE
jgi:hypothetical protein